MKFIFIPKKHTLSAIDIVNKKNSRHVFLNNGSTQLSLPAADVTKDLIINFFKEGVIGEGGVHSQLGELVNILLNPTFVTPATFDSGPISLHIFKDRKVVYYRYSALSTGNRILTAKNYRDALDKIGITDSLLSTPKYTLMKGLAYLKNETLVLGKRSASDAKCPGVDGVFEHQLYNLMVLKS